MINNKLGYGIIFSLACGLSGCYFDGFGSENTEYSTSGRSMTSQHGSNAKRNTDDQPQQQAQASTKKSTAPSASREPSQRESTGPKRTSAPQIPVIE
ncbi:MAG TPA: hypothetical protein PK657_07215 [Legionella sp.]|nr:hypothetical protein [Legionella sp.]